MNLIGENKVDEKEFLKFYIKNIAPKLQKVEETRLKTLKQFKRTCYIVIPIMIAVIAFCVFYVPILNLDERSNSGIIKLSFYVCFALSLPLLFIYRSYKKEVKERLFNALFKFCGDFYLCKRVFDKSDITPYGFLPSCSSISTDDSIAGKYKEISTQITEVELERNGGRDKYTVFKGLFCIFKLNKNFNGKTVVVKDYGILTKISDSIAKEMKNVKLEDPEFEKEFEVFSTDQIEARYLLTTAFMQHLLDLKKMFNANISCSFYREHLALAIKTDKNYFEPPDLFHKINDFEKYKHVIIELYSILSIVDMLKLDQNIGL